MLYKNIYPKPKMKIRTTLELDCKQKNSFKVLCNVKKKNSQELKYLPK